ncbi:MAG: response regulator transcription factor [Myxococcaceae bacterium]
MSVVLRDACQSIDRARADERTDPAALGSRWSLLDSFESNGRQYVVAARDTISSERPGLSPREAQVVGLLALGHSNKVISYELGLAWSTVRVLVHRAARKLGVGTRKELERTAMGFQESSRKAVGSVASAI